MARYTYIVGNGISYTWLMAATLARRILTRSDLEFKMSPKVKQSTLKL